MLERVLLLPIRYLIALDNFLIRRKYKMELYVVCKVTKTIIPLDDVEVVEYIDKKNGTAAKFICPFCDAEHTAMVMEHPK